MNQPVSSHLELASNSTYLTEKALEALCSEARESSLFGVCVPSSRVLLAREFLDSSPVKVVALVGYPTGCTDPDVKRYETEVAIDHGAHEIDYVVDVSLLKDGHPERIRRELRDAVEAADERPLKAVFDILTLSREEIEIACGVLIETGVRFFSNSSGNFISPVSPQDVLFIRERLIPAIGIKAVGNIHTEEAAQALIGAGANRVGIAPGFPRDAATSRC